MKLKYQVNSKNMALVLFFVYFFVGLYTFRDYGISIDEEFHRFCGLFWLDYILSFTSFDQIKFVVFEKLNEAKSLNVGSPEDFPFYGVIFDLPAVFLEVLFKIEDPQNYFYFKHFLNFLLFFVSSIFFYKLMLNRFLNNKTALIGALFFILSPRIYGESFFNNKDIVFLSLTTFSLYYCFKSIDKISYKNLLIFSIFCSLATAQRIIGIFLPITFIVFYFFSVISDNKKLKDLYLIIYFVVFYIIFLILFWPALWENPFKNIILAISYFSNVPLAIKMLFNGNYISNLNLPYNYIFFWILISTPILYIVLFALGYIETLKNLFFNLKNIENRKSGDDLWKNSNEKKDLLIFFIITSFVAFLIFYNVSLYTGWRQIYFLNIFIIYFAVLGFDKIDLYLKSKRNKNIFYTTISLYLFIILFKIIIYHPYQNIFFNSLYSNEKIHKKFEVDYWGLSGEKFLESILNLEREKNLIKIGVASYLPLERSLKIIPKEVRGKIRVIGQDFKNADYIYTNFMSEVDKNYNDKYKIPAEFSKIDEFILNNVKVYEVYKKSN
tara:strand:+ start:10952 stop:12607 length:1656 start_codon:yes stop_codon:yes gene_type:complete